MLLGFKKRFRPMILDGTKAHTIRAKRKHRPKVGETCHCYVGLRQKGAELLGRWECTKVQEIVILIPWNPDVEVSIANSRVLVEEQELDGEERNLMAWRDGFREDGIERAFETMMRFWIQTHGTSRKTRLGIEFCGDMIHWAYVPGTAKGKTA